MTEILIKRVNTDVKLCTEGCHFRYMFCVSGCSFDLTNLWKWEFNEHTTQTETRQQHFRSNKLRRLQSTSQTGRTKVSVAQWCKCLVPQSTDWLPIRLTAGKNIPWGCLHRFVTSQSHHCSNFKQFALLFSLRDKVFVIITLYYLEKNLMLASYPEAVKISATFPH